MTPRACWNCGHARPHPDQPPGAALWVRCTLVCRPSFTGRLDASADGLHIITTADSHCRLFTPKERP